MQVAEEIEDVIDHYFQCVDGIFVDFAQLLCKYKTPIINSFIMVTAITLAEKRNQNFLL